MSNNLVRYVAQDEGPWSEYILPDHGGTVYVRVVITNITNIGMDDHGHPSLKVDLTPVFHIAWDDGMSSEGRPQ